MSESAGLAPPARAADGADQGAVPGTAAAAASPGPDTAVQPGAVIDVTRLRVAIARLSRRLRKHELAGLTPTQLSALSTVDKAGPVRLGDLAAAEGIAPSTLTRLVSALEDSGYVQRCSVPGDARASTLAITELGHAELERIRRETTSLLTDSLTVLPAEQLAALAAALPALEHLADADPPGR
ncbi:MAG TPA: MarR family winged helix-turn-helix transcriptional regulator [Streptosporangiaceae bacterium]